VKTLSSERAQRQPDADVLSEKGIKVSIIVPVLNETYRIQQFLKGVRQRAPSAEVIVVEAEDSESISKSLAGLCDRVLMSKRGRAAQMNTGANAARGDVLWFVHADCEVPHHCLTQIAYALDDSRTVGGCFRIRFPRAEMIYRVSDICGNLAVDLFGKCYGDHGIFCRRDDFFAVSGYPDVPLFEDAEFYRRLRWRGRTRQLADEIVTSSRRYERLGPYRLTMIYLILSVLYFARAPIPLLARIYDRFCSYSDER
jgi:rSAM/selenodomain-associated transferase 2